MKAKEEKNWTCANRLEMFDSIFVIFFRILATQQHTFTQKCNTFTHTCTHTARDGVLTIVEICKADLPNKIDSCRYQIYETENGFTYTFEQMRFTALECCCEQADFCHPVLEHCSSTVGEASGDVNGDW